MELHRQANQLMQTGIKAIRAGDAQKGRALLELAGTRFEKAAYFSEGLAEDMRIRLAEDCRRLAKTTPPERPPTLPSAKKTDDMQPSQAVVNEALFRPKDSLPTWDDIGGLDKVKKLIKQTLVMAIIKNKPDLLEGWNSILFHGPPGTGKTMLAAAVARSIDGAFFDAKVSNLLSKWYGETPKIISAVFQQARSRAPAVIFLDEFDSIALSRQQDLHEETRRALSTLLAEMDGLSSKSAGQPFVLVIGATNTPDVIDAAIRSRFAKEIEIPLPDHEACKSIIQLHTTKKGLLLDHESVLNALAQSAVAKHMSGRDIKFWCMEAAWSMIDEMNPGLESLAGEPYEILRAHELQLRPLNETDFNGGVNSRVV